MKRNVIIFGLIAGAIVSALMPIMVINCKNNNNYEGSMIVGYAAMIVAFSFVFVGIKNYRDKYNNGIISFGKAFKIGFFIALIASTMYVIAWMITYYGFMPDFMDQYSNHMIEKLKASGTPQVEIDKQIAEMATFREMYKSSFGVALLTYAEILPVGIVITLISALILKRKTPKEQTEVVA